MNVLLKSAILVNPDNEKLHLKKRDILIKNGIIEKIAAKIEVPKNTTAVQLPNLHVSIGWLDTGVCFGEPGFEERETIANGLNVASKSGFTDIILNANTKPSPNTSADIAFFKSRSAGNATALHPLGNLTKNAEGRDLAELFDMQNAGAVAFYDFQKPISDANLLKIALLYTQNFDGLVCSYPQDNTIAGKGNVHEGIVSTRLGLKGIPSLAEELQIARDLFILEYTGGKLHIPTISTAHSVKLITEAKKKGLNVSCSVAIANLCTTDTVLEDFDTNTKVYPPLRTEKDVKALIKGVLNGTINFVTSNHVPVNIEEKHVEFENAVFGSIGLESIFGILNQTIGLESTVTKLTKGRDRFGIAAPKIEEGSKACFTLFNPEGESEFTSENIASTSKNSLFIGQKLLGKVYGIYNNNLLNLNN